MCLLVAVSAFIILRYNFEFYMTFQRFICVRRKVFNLIQHFVHLNLSLSLLVGLIIFISGIEAAAEHRVWILGCIIIISIHFRLVVSLWPSYFTTSSWLHLAGCCVKESYCSLC